MEVDDHGAIYIMLVSLLGYKGNAYSNNHRHWE